MTARCPFCEAVHPIPDSCEPVGQQLDCLCGATALLCAPNTEPETSVRLARKMGDRGLELLVTPAHSI